MPNDIPNSTWDEVDASNTAAVPNGAPEGWFPSDVNNWGRACMGATKRFWDHINVTETTAGSSTAYTLTYEVAPQQLWAGEIFTFAVNATCGAAPTLNVNGLGAKNIRRWNGSAWANLAAGEIVANQVVQAFYNSSGSGTYDIINSDSATATPPGVLVPYAGSTAPAGFLLCDGAAVSRTTYAALFAVISTTYGAGNGSTTFNVPDLRGRVVAGKDNMGGTAANRITNAVSGITGTTLGAAGGDQRMQQHSHGVNDPSHNHLTNAGNTGLGSGGAGNALWQSPSGNPVTSASAFTGISIQNAGSGGSENVQPTIILNYLIKT